MPTSLEHQDQDSDQAEKDTSDLQRLVTMRIQLKRSNESRECNLIIKLNMRFRKEWDIRNRVFHSFFV
jgi:hypothetical protein